MRLKKGVVALIISILILTIGTSSFAVTSTNEINKKIIKNEVSNEEENDNEIKTESKEDDNVENSTKSKEDNKSEIETESKEDNKSENKTESKDNDKNENKTEIKDDNNDENKIENKKDSKKENIQNSDKNSSVKKEKYSKVINSDITSAEENESVTYKDIIVNGNIFVANGDKVTLNNVKVDGDVAIFATEVEIKDSEIEGSIYLTTQNINVKNSEINSMYIIAETVNISAETEISRELRIVGSEVTVDSEVKRDTFIVAEKVEIGDEAKLLGRTVIKSDSKSVSEDANIKSLDFEKIEYATETSTRHTIITYLIDKGTEIAIILVIAIFVLAGFPKFTKVNSSLRIVDFFKAFLTGLLEFIVIMAIAIGLLFTGYGVGYGLIIINLLITFLFLGKIIFIISFAVRLSCNPEKISKIKAFFAIVLVALILDVIEMISLAGNVGLIIDVILNVILALTGLGTMFRVIFTSKKKIAVLAERKTEMKNKVKEINSTENDNNSKNKNSNDRNNNDNNNSSNSNSGSIGNNVTETSNLKLTEQKELQNEIKAEIKEEIKELKEEREEEKKLESNKLNEKDNGRNEPNEQDTKIEENKESNNSHEEENDDNDNNNNNEKEDEK